MLAGKVSFQVVLSREAIFCTINCIKAISIGTVEATAIVLRLVPSEILLTGEGNSSGKAGWFKTTMKLDVVLLMFTEHS
jgi:hypothetical protein